MAVAAHQLPELTEHAEGLRELIPLGRGKIYTYPVSGLGDIVLHGKNLPNRFSESGILAFRNQKVHPRYGDRLVARRQDNAPFGIVKFVMPSLEAVTRKSLFTDTRTNNLALRIDRDVPELPSAPALDIVDREEFIEFWGDLMDRLRADFDNR